MRLFAGPWGELRVFADEALPPTVAGIAEVPARFGGRFRPALLRFPLRRAWPEVPYVAVWPNEGTLPDLAEDAVEAPDDLAGVVLAELLRHKCFVCDARFEVLHFEVAIPVLGCNLARHRIVSGCPACGSDFARSRIDGLALLQLS
ncbi:hypothetical protein [Streptomyces hesseae]|uniref:Uncharacterized protein n=1 Tax=Streptomyces hesseae TaxID=3075519 RepID=A0ABU2SXT1_9ACTN|nr:hypothetical protein [Streptomyces sp. DSM 40473]MDT0453652.1 hypothetical protein [Streptomyces sp. DSM 40473]